MSRHLARRLQATTLATLLCLGGWSARADELPPKDAPAYSGVYKTTTRYRDDERGDWNRQTEDTVTIAVLPKQSRWDYKSDGRTAINDYGSRATTLFGGKEPPNTARRVIAPATPISWEFGYATVLAVANDKPKVLGTATIAGKECTKLRLVSDDDIYGEPEFCVTKTGIVLRFTNHSSNAETVVEAESITEAAPDKATFAVPAGYTVEEKRVRRR
jgi:hypothetical protein